jgi:N-acetylglutamate synthase-like GNAT family acetyltransferase
MNIRPARFDEAEVLSALALRSKAHWGYSQKFIEACRAELRYEPAQIESARWSFVVAEGADGIVGFYALERMSEKQIELAALFVEPEWIGKGVGRALLNDARYRARQTGSSVLTIQSDPYAAEFYQSMGAQPTGARESGSIPGRYLPTFAIDLHACESGEKATQ